MCEIGAAIGKLWRELSDEQKQKHNEDFAQAKVGGATCGPARRRVIGACRDATVSAARGLTCFLVLPGRRRVCAEVERL